MGMPGNVLLIHPPAAKPAEPPLGPAVLVSHLKEKGFAARAIDANIEAYLHLLDPERLSKAAGTAPSTAVSRAVRRSAGALSFLRSPAATDSRPRYAAAAEHLNRALSVYRGVGGRERLTLGDYRHEGVSEFSPADLARLAAGEESTLFADYFRDVLLPRVEALGPRLIGLSVQYRHQVLPAFELAGLLRRRFPGIPVVGGGGMFGSWREPLTRLSVRFPPFSAIVFGPGEASLAAMAGGDAFGPEYHREDGSCVRFVPDYTDVSFSRHLSPVPVLPVAASRGCYWRKCLFCPEASAAAAPFACIDPATFPDLLCDLSRRYGVAHFHLTDNAVPVPVLEALARRRDDLSGLSWHGFVRFERALLDPELVRDLARAGCRMLQLGLESGSGTVLERLGKGTRLPEAKAILENLRRAGISTYVYVLLGVPGETEEDAERTAGFLEANAAAIGYLNLAIFNLPRDSGFLNDPGPHGIRTTAPLRDGEPLGLYRSFEPGNGWGRDAARRFLSRRLLGSPPIREIVLRTPPFFTSNHAFLFS